MPKVVILFTDPSPLWYESIRHTFILAHHVTPLKGGWVHSISLGQERSLRPLTQLLQSRHSVSRTPKTAPRASHGGRLQRQHLVDRHVRSTSVGFVTHRVLSSTRMKFCIYGAGAIGGID